MENNCCNLRKKERTEKEFKLLINRLNRIEGQIRGIKKMVSENAYCIDILTQSAAASAAISAFNRELLSEHVKSCVVSDLKNGNDESVDELLDIMKKIIK